MSGEIEYKKLTLIIDDKVAIYKTGKSGVASIRLELERNSDQTYINIYNRDGQQTTKIHNKIPHILDI